MAESRQETLANCVIYTIDSTIESAHEIQEIPVSSIVKDAAEKLRAEISSDINAHGVTTAIQPSVCASFDHFLSLDNLPGLLSESDFECNLCLAVMHYPITCPCGHTWCKACLIKSLDYSPMCPMCRTKLPSLGYFLSRPPSKAIASFLNLFSIQHPSDMPAILPGKMPIFISSLAFPGTTSNFHMFESRYRVMMKRCIETDRKFGVVLPSINSGPTPCVEYGTVMYIKQFEPLLGSDILATEAGNLPRYVVECEALYRIKLSNIVKDSAGYFIADVLRIEDTEPEDLDNWNPERLTHLVHGARQFVDGILSNLPPPARYHFERQHGKMPLDPAELSFWMADFLPLNPYVLFQLLPLTQVDHRMSLICEWLQKCTV